MLPSIAVTSGRWLRAPLFVAAAIGVGGALGGWRVAEMAPSQPAWVDTCHAQMSSARAELSESAPELEHASVRSWFLAGYAGARLSLQPQYQARIVFDSRDEQPSVFDWEEVATPVAGSFALHRHVGHFDLLVVADDSDERGLAFAARMQPLLDACLMEAQ